LYPAGEECSCAVGGSDAAERDGFWSAGGPVDYREKIGETRGLWKGSYQVDVDVFKTAAWYGDGLWCQVYVS
jgi:hypothetical protein